MSLISELAATPGVLAAGEYSFRGDRFHFEGDMDDELARMASIMCRATSMGVHMQADMMSQFAEKCGWVPVRGWMVKEKNYSVCVVANYFCFLDHNNASVNDVVNKMQATLGEPGIDMV
ncbi:MAG: DUF2173 family protein [Gammaproteobacteria bacterium]|nr:DUF2173 family protein [Gammaproteobacteria bacterium]